MSEIIDFAQDLVTGGKSSLGKSHDKAASVDCVPFSYTVVNFKRCEVKNVLLSNFIGGPKLDCPIPYAGNVLLLAGWNDLKLQSQIVTRDSSG